MDGAGQGYALSVVAGGGADHPALLLLFAQQAEAVEGAADLVGAALLEHLGLQPDIEPGPLAQQARGQHRRAVDVGRDSGIHLPEVLGR